MAYSGERAQYGGGAVVGLKVRKARGQVIWGVQAVVQNGAGSGRGESVDDAAERTGADVVGEHGGVLVWVQGIDCGVQERSGQLLPQGSAACVLWQLPRTATEDPTPSAGGTDMQQEQQLAVAAACVGLPHGAMDDYGDHRRL
ncbi:hypothetical protein [Streptomyces sp. NPDC001340]